MKPKKIETQRWFEMAEYFGHIELIFDNGFSLFGDAVGYEEVNALARMFNIPVIVIDRSPPEILWSPENDS